MLHTRISDLLLGDQTTGTVEVHGWVRTRRDSKGGFSFIELNDGSCFKNLQLVADADLPNYAKIQHLHVGASLRVTGELRVSPAAGQAIELQATEVEIIGQCDPVGYPLQKKRMGLDKLREFPHIRCRTNAIGAVMRIRNVLAAATHEFFQAHGFIYLNSPIITASDCEGAGEMFRVTTLDLDAPPRRDDGSIDDSQDFFGKPSYLTVSGQLEGETYACGLSRVYTFGPTFRAENSHTSRHLSEFWMVEPEIAFADLATVADVAEAYVQALLQAVLTRCSDDLAFCDKFIEPGLRGQLEAVASGAFGRMPYTEAIDVLQRADASFGYEPKWGVDLQAEHERYLTEIYAKRPLIITDYPKSIKPFYMRVNDDDRTVAAMDVLVPRLGELIGGSQREERLDILDARMLEAGMDLDEYDWYRDLRRFGTVPHGGFGLGFERAVAYCTGMKNIRDVIPDPRTPGHA